MLERSEYRDELVAVISVNCTTINQEFNPGDPMNDKLFDFDPIRYMCLGPVGSEFNCNFPQWTTDAEVPSYVELKSVIEMRRQTTDFFDKDKLSGKSAPKIYTWDTPDKESTNNYQAFDVGMNGIGFRFNVNQQTRAVIKFRTLNDVISSVGGYKASIAGIFAVVYAIFFAHMIKKTLLNKIKD